MGGRLTSQSWLDYRERARSQEPSLWTGMAGGQPRNARYTGRRNQSQPRRGPYPELPCFGRTIMPRHLRSDSKNADCHSSELVRTL